MTQDEIRLECLRLVNRQDKTPEEIIARAREFEKFVVGAPSRAPAASAPGTSRK